MLVADKPLYVLCKSYVIIILILAGFKHSVAHPHIMIDMYLNFIFSDTGLSGIDVFWEFDAMNSKTILEDFDTNKNKKFEKSEVSQIMSSLFPSLKRRAFLHNYNMGKEWNAARKG